MTITQATPAITTTPSAGGVVGISISDTATVSGGFNPTGTVTFNLFPPTDATCAGTPVFTSTNPLSGSPLTATSGSFPTTAAGIYHWVAIYNGDTNNTTVSSDCAAEPVTIAQATPAIATTPSAGGAVGTSISDTATVTGGLNPTGTVTFNLFGPGDPTCSGAPLSTFPSNPLSGGSATSGSITTVAVGTYHWVATYNGDANNTTVSSACADEPVTITQATPAISTTPSAGGPVGTSISDTATVTGGFIPTGTVTFELFPPADATCAGTPVFTSPNSPLSGGSATSAPPFATTAVGAYHWVATYNGDANNTTVSSDCAAEPVTIAQATPAIATTPSAGGVVGTSISDTATVTGGFIPTGTVTFELFPPTDATCAGTPVFTSPNSPLSGGSATSAPPFATTAVGAYHWVAIYNGDANNTTVRSDCAAEPVTTAQATPTIATTPSAGGPVGVSISDTATVSGGFNPTGTVTFNLFPPTDATCAGTPVFTSPNSPLSGGSATSAPPSPPPP